MIEIIESSRNIEYNGIEENVAIPMTMSTRSGESTTVTPPGGSESPTPDTTPTIPVDATVKDYRYEVAWPAPSQNIRLSINSIANGDVLSEDMYFTGNGLTVPTVYRYFEYQSSGNSYLGEKTFYVYFDEGDLLSKGGTITSKSSKYYFKATSSNPNGVGFIKSINGCSWGSVVSGCVDYLAEEQIAQNTDEPITYKTVYKAPIKFEFKDAGAVKKGAYTVKLELCSYVQDSGRTEFGHMVKTITLTIQVPDGDGSTASRDEIVWKAYPGSLEEWNKLTSEEKRTALLSRTIVYSPYTIENTHRDVGVIIRDGKFELVPHVSQFGHHEIINDKLLLIALYKNYGTWRDGDGGIYKQAYDISVHFPKERKVDFGNFTKNIKLQPASTTASNIKNILIENNNISSIAIGVGEVKTYTTDNTDPNHKLPDVYAKYKLTPSTTSIKFSDTPSLPRIYANNGSGINFIISDSKLEGTSDYIDWKIKNISNIDNRWSGDIDITTKAAFNGTISVYSLDYDWIGEPYYKYELNKGYSGIYDGSSNLNVTEAANSKAKLDFGNTAYASSNNNVSVSKINNGIQITGKTAGSQAKLSVSHKDNTSVSTEFSTVNVSSKSYTFDKTSLSVETNISGGIKRAYAYYDNKNTQTTTYILVEDEVCNIKIPTLCLTYAATVPSCKVTCKGFNNTPTITVENWPGNPTTNIEKQNNGDYICEIKLNYGSNSDTPEKIKTNYFKNQSSINVNVNIKDGSDSIGTATIHLTNNYDYVYNTSNDGRTYKIKIPGQNVGDDMVESSNVISIINNAELKATSDIGAAESKTVYLFTTYGGYEIKGEYAIGDNVRPGYYKGIATITVSNVPTIQVTNENLKIENSNVVSEIGLSGDKATYSLRVGDIKNFNHPAIYANYTDELPMATLNYANFNAIYSGEMKINITSSAENIVSVGNYIPSETRSGSCILTGKSVGEAVITVKTINKNGNTVNENYEKTIKINVSNNKGPVEIDPNLGITYSVDNNNIELDSNNLKMTGIAMGESKLLASYANKGPVEFGTVNITAGPALSFYETGEKIEGDKKLTITNDLNTLIDLYVVDDDENKIEEDQLQLFETPIGRRTFIKLPKMHFIFDKIYPVITMKYENFEAIPVVINNNDAVVKVEFDKDISDRSSGSYYIRALSAGSSNINVKENERIINTFNIEVIDESFIVSSTGPNTTSTAAPSPNTTTTSTVPPTGPTTTTSTMSLEDTTIGQKDTTIEQEDTTIAEVQSSTTSTMTPEDTTTTSTMTPTESAEDTTMTMV